LGADGIWRSPAGYASGTPYVAYDQLAYVHRGEAVISAALNKQGGGVNIASGAIQVTAQFGSDVSQAAGLRAAQWVGDKLAEVIQVERSRIAGSAS
jgi:hypothetical protein